MCNIQRNEEAQKKGSLHWPIDESDSLSENPKLMQRRKDSGSIPPPSSELQRQICLVKICTAPRNMPIILTTTLLVILVGRV